MDQLLATDSDSFRVDGSGSSELTITAIGPREFFTLQEEFVEFLKTVSFVSDDQAAYIERNITLVVQEHPLETSPPSLPAVIPVVFLPVNDRPMILSILQSQANLTDYLPESSNQGFSPLFLLNENNVEDIDYNSAAFIGLAITAYTGSDSGCWMVLANGIWRCLSSVSECSPELVPPDGQIRFTPYPDHSKADTLASLVYRAWDGTALIECVDNSPVFSDRSALSAESETFTYSVQYLNRAPSVSLAQYALPSIEEDVSADSSEGVIVSIIADAVGSDTDDLYLGLAVVGADSANGVWQYRDTGSWTDFPTQLSPEWALLLRSDNRVRFIPDRDYFGGASFTALIWDMSDHTTNTTTSNPYTGAFSTEDVSINISVDGVNDPPVIELGTQRVEYTEAGPAIRIFRNLTIQDVDSAEIEWALVILQSPPCVQDRDSGDAGSGLNLTTDTADVILARHAPPNFLTIVEHRDTTQIELRVTGSDNSPQAFARYLESLYFTSTCIEPSSTPREVRLIINDGLNNSDSVSLMIAINLVNDEPPLVDLPYPSITWVEDSGPLQLFSSSVKIVDLDDNSLFFMTSATLELRNYNSNYEQLAINCSQLGIHCDFEAGVLTLNGEQPIHVYQQALSEVYYINTNPEPADHTREVYITVTDGLHSSPVARLLVAIELINDQLPVIVITQEELVFQEPDSNPITTRVRVAPSVNITDSDSGNFLLHSATITIIDPQDNEQEGLLLGDSQINVTVDQSQHSLTLFSDGGVPLISLRDALRAVEYFHSAEQMYDTDRVIEITVSDNLTLAGVQMSDSVQVRVAFIRVDDPPEVRLIDTSLLYNEGQTPEQLSVAVNAEIVDVDSNKISRIEIELTADSTIDISLDSLQIDLTGFESLITQPLSNSSTYIILTGEADVSDYESVIRTLTYQHLETPGDPDTGIRTITVTPFTTLGEPGTADTVNVVFHAVNNAPVVDLNGIRPGLNNTAFFQEESTNPILLTESGVRISDVDSETLTDMKIALWNALNDEMEYIDIGTTALDVVVQTNVVVELRGQPSPISEFEAALSTLTYHNLADEPDTSANRIVLVEVYDGELSGFAQIEVIITPVNDAPRFVLNERSILYFEEETVQIAAAAQVFDPDSLIVEYRVRPVTRFAGDMISGPFISYAQDLGGVYIASFQPMTPDMVATMLENVTYTSNGTEPLTGNRVFCISVQDQEMATSPEACVTVDVQVINDNIPEFGQPSYQARVMENWPNTFVAQISAEDADSVNSNVTLVYSITAGDDCFSTNMYTEPGSGLSSADTRSLLPEEDRPCRFQIDPLTAEVTTTSSAPDREERDSYTLTVTVSDGEFSSDAELVVAIDDMFDVAPVFIPEFYEVTLPVGAEEGHTVVQLTVFDPDLNDDFSLIFISMVPNIGREIFALDQNIPGRVILNRPERELDSSVSRYVLTFEAVDSSFNESLNVATVVVNVVQNQDPPVFGMSSYTAMVLETASDGFSVLTVNATDNDPEYHGVFSFLILDTVPFAVDPQSGHITVSDSDLIDFEMVEEYVFYVVATDTGRPQMSSSVEVRVGVVNVNDNPPMFDADSYEVEVCEGVPIGHVILELTAQDMDGDALNYDLVPMFGCLGCVTVNSTTGVLSVAREIDFEEQHIFSFSISVNDGPFFGDVVVTVGVLNDNEAAPEFTFDSLTIEIPETQEPGSLLPFPVAYIPLASDTDACNIDQCDGTLIINSQTCDLGSGLQYSIVSGNEEGLFEINPSNGLISVSQDLDFDMGAHQEFNLSLQVWDGEFNDNVYLTIIVTDVNDNQPEFQNDSYSVAIAEDAPVGTTIITTLAIDLDPADILQYSLIDEENLGYFIITETGDVVIAAPLDFETIPRYNLIVAVTDRPSIVNATAVLALLTVYVTDVNDVAPVFSEVEYRFSTPENNLPGPIGTIRALDQDPSNFTLFYSIISPVPDGDFVIDSLSGLLESIATFDRENQSSYEVTVQAVDNGLPPLSATVTVTIDIEDVNENPPLFLDDTPSKVNVSESTSINTTIITLHATDADSTTLENSALGFRILSGAPTFSLYQLHPQTVHLILSDELDYEVVMQYNLIIEVFDMADSPEFLSLSSTTEIEVIVVDENDNSPLFAEAVYSAEIAELSAVGTTVLKVQAIDSDSSINAVIVYGILDSSSPFAINPDTGVITVANSEALNIELTGPQISLTVSASNPNTTLQSSTMVVVDLLDINNNAPFFSPDEFTFIIPEDFTPTGRMVPDETSGDVDTTSLFSGLGSGESPRLVATVTAFDLDEASNAELRFSLVTESHQFFIDPLSGEVFVIGTLDREVQDAYSIDVHVTDTGTPALENTTSVLVIVSDINDNIPTFQQGMYSGRVLEGQPAGIDVLQVSASDSDIGENANIQFLILDGSVPFYIDPLSGIIQTTQQLDRERQDSWTFQVLATDGELSSTADVTISVEDENDHPPTISPSRLTINVTENTNINSVIQTFNINDADLGINSESNVSFRATTDLFSIDGNGVLRVAGLIDYEMVQNVTLEVVVRNVAPPHFETTAHITILINNFNDNPPVVQFGVTSVQYDELIQRRVLLDIGIRISDGDGQEDTRLIDGIVEFSNEFIEPSFAYEPVSTGDIAPDFNCPLEVNKRLKFSPCGIPEVTILSQYTEGILLLQGGLIVGENVVGDSIVLNASQKQYATYIGNVGTLDANGLTISTWIWFEPTTSPESQAILSKISSSQLLYGIFCNSDGSLEFVFTSESSPQNVIFPGGCSALEGAWHHLGIVVDNSNTSQWTLNVFVNGEEIGSADILQPFDSTGGFLIGAARASLNSPTTHFFNGRIHMLAVSLSSSDRNKFNCVTGCGLVLISLGDSPLTHYYNYSQRALIIEGTQPIGPYEDFLNSLALVLPFTEPRVSQYRLSYTVQDDLFNCLPQFIDIIVIASNDFQPELSLNGTVTRDYSTIFIEEGGPVDLVNRTSFYLTDMDLIEFEYVVTVSISNPLQPFTEEVLVVQNIPTGMNVSYTSDHTLTLTGNLPLPMFEAVVRSLRYDNTADEPVGTSRQVVVTVSDPPMPTVSASTFVSVVSVNDPPELVMVSSLTEYSEGDGAVPILQSATVTDSDDSFLVSAIITFSPLDTEMEVLSADATNTAIAVAYNSTSSTLTLTGEDTLENYSAVILSITYEHIGDATPSLGTRVFSIVLSDGEVESDPEIVMLFFAAVNDAPVIDLNGDSAAGFNYRVNFVEDEDEIVSIVSPNATIIDIDGDSLMFVGINLTNPQQNEAIVVPTPSDGIRVIYVSDSIVELHPTSGNSSPISDFEAVLRSVQFRNMAEEPTPGTRIIQFMANDGEDSSLQAVSEISVLPTNDRPQLDLDTVTIGTGFVADSFEEGGDPVNITARLINLRDNDVDATVTLVIISIQSAFDGLDERIESTDPNLTLPVPANGQAVTYMIDFNEESLANVVTILLSLQYRNARLEPTPGERVISVAVSDGITFSNTAIVFLNVIGVNENIPQFTIITYAFMVGESQQPPTPVGTVTAVDVDDGRDGEISYEIVDSKPLEGLTHFTIDTTSGEISTAVELDWEAIRSYSLTISATDGGLPQRTANATVTIHVVDINDNPPVFSPDNSFNITVLESRETGYVVDTILVTDPDSGNDVISLVLLNPEVPFSVGVFSHEITVGGDLDIDSQSLEGCSGDVTYILQVEATDSNFPNPSSTAIFTVHVIDVNDNEPQFVSDSTFAAEENNENLYLFSVSATDKDCTVNGEVTYSFINSSTYNLFNIHQTTGDVSSLEPLDREEREYYQFTVLATDGGMPRHTVSTTVLLQILDLNDNPPIFSEALYTFITREDQSNRTLGSVVASDVDAGMNGMVAAYYLDARVVPVDQLTNEPLFTVDPTLGYIYFSHVSSNITEFESNITLTVFAEDAGSPPLTGTTTVVITVIDINDNAPEIISPSTQAEVPENAPNFLVTSFSARDLDSGANGDVFFRLLTNTDLFVLNQTTGDLTTVSGLDFEDECYYLLSVEAYDGGTPSLSSPPHLLEVLVQPVEDIPPVFTFGSHSSYQASVPENSPVGTAVIQVMTEDGDLTECRVFSSGAGSELRPDQIVYSFLEVSNFFTINIETGELSLQQSLDYEETQQHILTVLATDSAGLQAEETVTINVLDRNDHTPLFQQPFYEAVVPENTAVSSSVLQVLATDADALDQGRLSYFLTNNPPYFDIGRSDGVVYVSGNIDFESAGGLVSFSVVVTDSAPHTANVSVTITIVDINDLPPVINTQPETLLFTEGQVSLQPFPTMNISDPDSFQHLCNATVLLYTPEQTVIGPLQQCICTDASIASTCTAGCLEFIQISTDSFPGSIVQLQGGYELRLDGNYSIEEYESALESVEYVNVIFNPEPQQRTISVNVFDCQLYSNTLVQSINIQPLNVVPPSLDINGDGSGISYQTTFTERGMAISIVSDNVTISDDDMAGMEQVLTSIDIRLTNPHDEQESIFISSTSELPADISVSANSTHITLSGVASLESYAVSLRLLRYINLASEPNPTLRVVEFTAHEFFLSSVMAYTEITIATINDFPPSVLANPPQVNYVTTYTEGTVGVNVVASDAVIIDEDSTNENVTEMQVYVYRPDSNDRLFLTGQTVLSPSVTIVPTSDSSLSVTGSAPLSAYETVLRNIQYQYTGDEFASLFPPRVVFIQIADNYLSGFTTTWVEFSPVNDHLPQFIEDSITVSVHENATVGTSLYQVQYSDADTFTPTNVNFSIVGGNVFFSIEPDSGVIILNELLDRETTAMHNFTVQLTDEGLVTSTESSIFIEVTVLVTDQNDHVPMFTQEFYNATVDEGAPIGTSVLQVFANDQDSQMHSLLEFSVTDTTDFRVDATGTLYTNTGLDQETVPSYQFVVSVRNPGDIAADTADIFITIIDVNDHPPSILLSPDSATLQEPQTRISLSSSLTITDLDANPSLDYGIVEILEDAPGVLIATVSLPGITVTGDGSRMIIFSGASQSLNNYEQVLQGVVYEDTAEEPLPITREIAYQVGSDSDLVVALNYTSSETTSNVTTFQVLVVLINDQTPEIQLDTRTSASLMLPECTETGSYSTNFTEGGDPVRLSDDSLTITDADSGDTTLHWATVELVHTTNEELLQTLHYSGDVLVNTSASSNTRLVLQGPASLAEFEAALHAVTYQSLSQEPMGITQATFTVNDGKFTSSPVLACVQLFEVNDPPVLTLGAAEGSVDIMLMYNEGQTDELLLAEHLQIFGKLLVSSVCDKCNIFLCKVGTVSLSHFVLQMRTLCTYHRH